MYLLKGIESKSSKLRVLDLNLSSLNLSDDFFKCLAESIIQLEKMTDLNLNFEKCKLTDEAPNRLADAIKKRSGGLTSLLLNFDWCQNLSQKTISLLSNSFSGDSASLQKLSLNFIGCKNGSIVFEDLALLMRDKSLNKLQDLQLSLPLNDWYSSKQHVEDLANSIRDHQGTLQEINLTLYGKM